MMIGSALVVLFPGLTFKGARRVEWMPDLHLGWLNGWIPLARVSLTDRILFLAFAGKCWRGFLTGRVGASSEFSSRSSAYCVR